MVEIETGHVTNIRQSHYKYNYWTIAHSKLNQQWKLLFKKFPGKVPFMKMAAYAIADLSLVIEADSQQTNSKWNHIKLGIIGSSPIGK